MSWAAALRHRASDSPLGTFFIVLVALSALLATAHYAVYGPELPTLAVITYAWTPMISAGVTVWLLDESIRDWLGQLGNLRVGVHWYLAGVGIMMLGTEFEVIVALLLGGDVSVPKYPLAGYALSFAVTLLLAGALEELGWRGFLQPRLQQRFGAVPTSVGIGVLWALWHVPMILGGGGNFTVFWEYVLNLVAISVVLGWLYNNTEGALPVVMVTHASHNMPVIGDLTGSAPAVFDVLSGDTVLYLSCALLITLYAGVRTLTRDGTLPGVPGQPDDLPPRGEETTAS